MKKRQMKKRGIAVLCLIGALAVMCAGCKGGVNGTGQEVSQADVGGKEKEKIKVTFIKNEWHGDPNEMEIFKLLEEKTGVEVEWQVYSAATWNDKKNLILSSGDLPDVFYMNAVDVNDVTKYSQQGMFIDLTDYIEEYCPNLKKAFEEMPEFKNICVNQDDGKIYSIGRAVEREASNTPSLFYINKTWLDKLGLPVPQTIDEYYTALKAFKDNDMNGNGDTGDELPFIFHFNSAKPDITCSYQQLFGAFGYVDPVLPVGAHFLEDENGEVVYAAEQEEYKEAIQYFHKFVEEGLWDSEGFTTQDQSVMNAKGNSDPQIVGSFMAFDASLIVSEKYLKDYVILEPLAGPKGDRLWVNSANTNKNVNGTQFVMTTAAKGKEEAIMRWLDAHFEPEISAQLFLGTIGTTLVRTESGMLDYAPTPEGLSYSEFRYKHAPVHVPCKIASEEWGNLVQIMDEDINKLQIAKEHYVPYSKQSSLFLLPNKEESRYFSTTAKDIDDYVMKMQIKWLTEGGIETEWDTYLEELNKLGLEKYKETIKGVRERMKNQS